MRSILNFSPDGGGSYKGNIKIVAKIISLCYQNQNSITDSNRWSGLFLFGWLVGKALLREYDKPIRAKECTDRTEAFRDLMYSTRS